jgi:predicted CXXCH cytochrome family protein
VAGNGCENCHIPHSAGSPERLLYYAFEEDNCLACHDGGVAATDIEDAITRPYGHPVQNFTGLHDAAEDVTTGRVPVHVECSDCHDPHQANGDPSPGGSRVSGATRGVSGVSAAGAALSEARYVYEICFKCHADNNVIRELSIVRQIEQHNTRLEFDPANPSFHPVEASGRNPDVVSLLPPYTAGSTISCTDCHGASNGAAAKGPHGSDWRHLLTERYVTNDFTPESPSSYALCYRCHSRSGLLSDESFPHSTHVVDQSAPCSACHDPHGVSYMQGNLRQNSHLINFDLDIVSPNATGRLEFIDQGRFQGQCYLNCHGKPHAPESYSH